MSSSSSLPPPFFQNSPQKGKIDPEDKSNFDRSQAAAARDYFDSIFKYEKTTIEKLKVKSTRFCNNFHRDQRKPEELGAADDGYFPNEKTLRFADA